MFDELYRYTVLEPSRNTSTNVVDLPKPNSALLKAASENQPDWSIERVQGVEYLKYLLAHRSAPPSLDDLLLSIQEFDNEIDDDIAPRELIINKLDSKQGQAMLGGLGTLFNLAISSLPESASELHAITDAIVLADTMRSHLETEMTETEWLKSAQRHVLWRPSDQPDDLRDSSNDLKRLNDIGKTYMALERIDECLDFGESIKIIMNTPMGDEILPLLREKGTESVRTMLDNEGHELAKGFRIENSQPLAVPISVPFATFGTAGFVSQQPFLEQNKITPVAGDWARPFKSGKEYTPLQVIQPVDGSLRRIPSKLKSIGRQELIVVRSRHLGYRLTELSHIENIAPFEKRERNHQVETEVSTVDIRETEIEEETKEDLATTTRDELRQEIQKKTREQFELSGKVRATYRGPGVEVGAEASASLQSVTERSSNTAREHAVEVVEEASTRVKERVLHRNERRFKRLVRESNHHSYSNTTQEGFNNSYYWLQKVDRVALYNYGERWMYEVLVPDPSAHLRSLSSQPSHGPSYTKPPPTVYFESLFSGTDGVSNNGKDTESTNKRIDEHILAQWKNGNLSSNFDLSNLEPPQGVIWAESVVMNGQPSGDSGKNATTFISKKETLKIAENREAILIKVTVQTHANGGGPMPVVSISVGDIRVWTNVDTLDRVTRLDRDGSRDRPAPWTYQISGKKGILAGTPQAQDIEHTSARHLPIENLHGSLELDFYYSEEEREPKREEALRYLPSPMPAGDHEVAVVADDFTNIIVKVSAKTVLSVEGKENWLRELKSAVVTDYWNQYETHMALQMGSSPELGDEPLEDLSDAQAAELREIERDEIKRAVIAIIRNQDPGGISSIHDGNPNVAEWFSKNRDYANEIVFLEQAFEWQHLDFILYGYYWSNHRNWRVKIFGLQGGDRAFREFMKAGAARVRLPVREGYKTLVEDYMAGLKWPKERARITVDFVAEKTSRLGRPGDEVPVCEPVDGSENGPYKPVYWDVATPTDLVLLRTWEDPTDIPLERWIPPSDSEMTVADNASCPDPLSEWSMATGTVPDDPSSTTP